MALTFLVILIACTLGYVGSLPFIKKQITDYDSLEAIRQKGFLRIAPEWDWYGDSPFPFKVAVRNLYAGIFMSATWLIVGWGIMQISLPWPYISGAVITAASTLLWSPLAKINNAIRGAILGVGIYGENRYGLTCGPLLTVVINVAVLSIAKAVG